MAAALQRAPIVDRSISTPVQPAPSGEGGTGGWFFLAIVCLFVCSGTMQPLLISTLGYNGAYAKRKNPTPDPGDYPTPA